MRDAGLGQGRRDLHELGVMPHLRARQFDLESGHFGALVVGGREDVIGHGGHEETHEAMPMAFLDGASPRIVPLGLGHADIGAEANTEDGSQRRREFDLPVGASHGRNKVTRSTARSPGSPRGRRRGAIPGSTR